MSRRGELWEEMKRDSERDKERREGDKIKIKLKTNARLVFLVQEIEDVMN